MAAIQSQILQLIVDHVQKQFEELSNSTKDIPGFHQDILPKFAAYVLQLRSTASHLIENASSASSAFSPFVDACQASINKTLQSLDHEEVVSHLQTNAEIGKCDQQVEAELDRFVECLHEKARACSTPLATSAKHLEVLEDHIILVNLNKQLDRWISESEERFQHQDVATRAAQVQLATDIATLVQASEVDVKNVSAKINAKHVDAAVSPPTFKDAPSPPKVLPNMPQEPNRPSIPALWTTQVSEEKAPLSLHPQRVTLDSRRPFRVNVFDDDDDDDDVDEVSKQGQGKDDAAATRGAKGKGMENMLSSQLTFRPKVPKLVSPRFGKLDARVKKAPSNPSTAVKKIAKVIPPRRLSLGAKMARRSVSANAWSDD